MIATALLFVAPPAHATDILICYASSYNQDVVQKLTAIGVFGVVDTIDCAAGTPSAVELAAYDAVLVYSDFGFMNGAQLGDRLADYVDTGGGVVEAVFANGSIPLSGRFESGGYEPITGSQQGGGAGLNIQIDDPLHPIMAGVATFNGGTAGFNTSDAAVANGALRQARWSNGLPLVATLQTHVGNTVGLNFFPPSSTARADFWEASTDGALLLANALEWAGNADSDLDGLFGSDDNCPNVANPLQENADGDRVGDVCDNCIDVPNDDQRDRDVDGFGLECDCNDEDDNVHPGVDELCDEEDDDCDGNIDEDAIDAGQLFTDADGDGQGDPNAPVLGCEESDGLVTNDADCDDGSAQIKVGAGEICDGVDNDCDGDVDPIDVCPVEDEAPPPEALEENLGGCGCNQGPRGGIGLLVAAALLLRRRRAIADPSPMR